MSAMVLDFLIGQQRSVGAVIGAHLNEQQWLKTITQRGIDPEQCAYVDISPKDENGSFRAPDHMDKIDAAVRQILRDGIHEFVILDSLDALAKNNNNRDVEKFIHRLVNHLKEHELKGIMLASSELDNDLLESIGHICDKRIDLV